MKNHSPDPHGSQVHRAAVLLIWLCATNVLAQDSPPGYRTYPLKHVKADDIADRVRTALGGKGSKATVLIDSQLNQLVVNGSDDAQRITRQLLSAIDQPPVARAQQEPSKEGEAAAASEVKGYRVQGDLNAITRQLQNRFRTRKDIRLMADERTQRVIVIGPADAHTEIAQLLSREKGDDTGASRAPAIVGEGTTYKLRYTLWQDLEQEIHRLWGGGLTTTATPSGDAVSVSVRGPEGAQRIMEIDRRLNQVTFFGNGRTVGMWNTFVTAFDSPRDDVNLTTGFVPLRNADPAKVLYAVSLLQPSRKKSSQPLNAEPADSQPSTKAVRISTGEREGRARSGSNLVSMIFQQPVENPAPQAKPAVPQPQNPPADEQKPEASAQKTESIRIGGQDQTTESVGGGGLVGSVQIEIINDVIILRGRGDDLEKVKKMIEDIERLSKETQPDFDIHRLQFINSEAAATLVNEIYEDILIDRQGPVSIRALVEPNAILLIGRKESFAIVKQMLEALDQPTEPSNKFEVFRLKHAKATDAETTIRTFFTNNPTVDTTNRAGIGARVRIISDIPTNSLIVQASARDLDEVRRLIESIDVDDVPATAEFRIFKLKNALATDLATVLQSAISGSAVTTTQATTTTGGTTSSTTLPSNALQLFMVDQKAGELIRSGILLNVQVTADPNTNALLVRAPAKSMPLIAALIEQLDNLPDVSAQLKVFEIKNGDATSLATVLQTLFGLTTTTTAGVQTNLTVGGTTTTTETLQPATGGGDTSVVPLRLSVDTRTNSIIASGSDADLRVVGTLLLRLDESLDDRKLAVVRLRNTQSAAVATAIQSYLTTRQTRIQQQLITQGVTSVYEQIDQEVFIVSEDITNSIIVSATPRYMDEVLKVIHELDIRQPMVLVQVLIAEIELRNTFQFGLELGFQEALLFDRGRAALNVVPNDASNPGFNFNGAGLPNQNSLLSSNLAGQTLTTFGLGRVDPTLGYGGLVVSAASDSVSILLRALEEKGMVQVLSRPQVMTMHNQPAYVQVGADVARITGSTLSTFGTQNNVTDVSTGLILSILPLINDDGIVMLGVEAERSALGDEATGTTVAINTEGDPVRVAPINVTRASTTISARSGQTVVFAGLITKQNEVTLRRIPWIADIPIIGHAFEFKDTFERRTELLIVMTPYVIRDDADLEMFKMQESERMSWCLADVMSVGADTWGLQGGHCAFCSKDVPMIFPDETPAGIDVHDSKMEPTPATSGHHSHRRGGQFQPQAIEPAPVHSEPVVWPEQPTPETAAMHWRAPTTTQNRAPENDTVRTADYGKNGVAPANYQPSPSGTVRLPPAR